MSRTFWVEEDLTPRVDKVTRGVTVDDREIHVAHPKWFHVYDIVRLGMQRIITEQDEATGKMITRCTNEAVIVLGIDHAAKTLKIQRALGRNPAQAVAEHEPTMVISSACAEQPDEEEAECPQ